ncbi:MAG: RHS repeat-associated core domain-containing protein, partial [Bacteroidales bacterium]|nr:RHS repeat-associated core domain-containing protein [Bacteroidales bacterium]
VISSNDRLGFRIMQAEQQARADLLELVEEGDVPIETPSVEITSLHPNNATSNIYYYHTNHLGSTAYVTDNNATITQGFLYAPFGEITTEYNATFGNDIIPKYSFNAKELDEETGMYYYEARYYKPPVFTSRDAMFEKYFWMTPYAYCANNPVKYVDPSGRDFDPVVDEKNKTITIKATYCTTNADKKRLKKALKMWNNQSGIYTYSVGDGDNVKEYTLNFKLTMKVVKNNDKLGDAAERGQNFFQGREADDICSDCWAMCDGANILAKPTASTRSIGHEIGHTLGIADHPTNTGLMLSGGTSSEITEKHIATILKTAGIESKNYNNLHVKNEVVTLHTYSMSGILKKKDKQ